MIQDKLQRLSLALAKRHAAAVDALIFCTLPAWAGRLHRSKLPQVVKVNVLKYVLTWYKVEIRTYLTQSGAMIPEVHVMKDGKEIGVASATMSISEGVDIENMRKCSRCPNIMVNAPAAVLTMDGKREEICEECLTTLYPV